MAVEQYATIGLAFDVEARPLVVMCRAPAHPGIRIAFQGIDDVGIIVTALLLHLARLRCSAPNNSGDVFRSADCLLLPLLPGTASLLNATAGNGRNQSLRCSNHTGCRMARGFTCRDDR